MKKLTDAELKKAHIFDLTDDPKIIEEVLGFTPADQKEFADSLSEHDRIWTLMVLADLSKSAEFRQQVEHVFNTKIPPIPIV